MSGTLMSLLVKLGVDADGLTKGLNDAEKQTTKSGNKIASTLGNIGSSLVVGGFAMAASAAVGLAAGLADCMKEASGAEDVLSQVEATIAATNGVAGVSAKMLQNMASELQNVTKFSDDVTMAAGNVLLTFTNIGSGVFPDVLKATQDMAQSLKMDLSSAAMMAGKAMNDPIAGVTALRKNGVQLSDEQERQVKSFMAVNDVASAQAVILQELQKEFGGSAIAAGNTLSGQLMILKNTFDDLKESIGAPLLEGANQVVGTLRGYLDSVIGIVNNSSLTLQQKIGAVGGVIGKIITDVAKSLPEMVKVGIDIIKAIVEGIIASIPVVIPAIVEIAMSIVNYFVKLVPVMIDAGLKLFIGLAQGIAQSLPTLIPAIVEMITQVVQVVVNNLPMLLDAGLKVLMGIADGIMAALPVLIDSALMIIPQLITFLLEALPKLLEASVSILLALVDGIIDSLPVLIPASIDMLITVVDALIDNLPLIIDAGNQMGAALIKGMGEAVVKAIPILLGSIGGAIQNALQVGALKTNLGSNIGGLYYQSGGPIMQVGPTVHSLPATTPSANALGNTFGVPQSIGYEGMRLFENQTVSGGETVTVHPKGESGNEETNMILEGIQRELQLLPFKMEVPFKMAMATMSQ